MSIRGVCIYIGKTKIGIVKEEQGKFYFITKKARANKIEKVPVNELIIDLLKAETEFQ